ncbi:MAG: response regulator [Actinobacteria bacterium]|nr:response regulator [Actinomycetota bacterium]
MGSGGARGGVLGRGPDSPRGGLKRRGPGADGVGMKVLLVDDHAPIRRGIRQLLELRAEFEVVGEGSNGEEAVRQVDELEPDIVLMDMNMPVMNGADATRVIKERHPDVHVVGLTAFGEMSLVSAMVNAGAAGYLLKGGAPDELIDSLNAVARGQGALDKGVTKAVMDDMAEMHKKEAKAYAELDQMKSEFVSVITHELRTPLTSIKGGVHTLKRGWNEVDEQMKLEFLDSIDRQCDRLSHMVEKILLVSGIQRGGLGLEPTVFRLDNITQEAMNVLATKSAGRTVVLDTAPVEATGDPKRLMEVIVALLDNALTFTEGRIDIFVGLAGDRPYVRVKDEGPGMEQDTLDHMLQAPFIQGDSSSTRATGGLGLSLYIAKQTIAASQGRLQATTDPERGSSFTMFLTSPGA